MELDPHSLSSPQECSNIAGREGFGLHKIFSLFPSLKKSGNNYIDLCPFHNDTHPSFTIYPDGHYHCFGCGAHGKIKDLPKKLGKDISLSDFSVSPSKSQPPRKLSQDDHRALFEAVSFYYEQLWENEKPGPAYRYLVEERGLFERTLARYALGYANGKSLLSIPGLTDNLRGALCDLGLIKAGPRDFFEGCIVFPNFSLDDPSKVSYITGRGYPEKKHLRPPANCLRRDSLYCESFARLKKVNYVILVEGEIDTLTLRQADFNAVGLYGVTSFTKEDVKRLLSWFQWIIIALDGDKAGREATQRILEMFGGSPQVLPLIFPFPHLKDWNDLWVIHFKKNFRDFWKFFNQLLGGVFEEEVVQGGGGYLEYNAKLSKPHQNKVLYNRGFLGKFFEFKRGKRWGAYTEFIKKKEYFWVLDCINKGRGHWCPGPEENLSKQHIIFKHKPCGDRIHCPLDARAHASDQADKVIKDLVMISNQWKEKNGEWVYATLITFSFPKQLWRRINYKNFSKVEREIIDAALYEYFNAQFASYNSKHYWHSKEPVKLRLWWYPHLHSLLLNLIKVNGEYRWVSPYIDEEKLKIIIGKKIAEFFKIPYKIKKELKDGKEVTYFYYIFRKGIKRRINLKISKFVPINNELYIFQKGPNKGKKAPFTNIQYLHGRVAYNVRRVTNDIVDYIDKKNIDKFTEKQMKVVESLIDGPPKNWRRNSWRGWLTDSVKNKNLAILELHSPTQKEIKEKTKKEPVICPVHNLHTILEREGSILSKPKLISINELKRGDIILSLRYKQDGKYWIVKEDLKNGFNIDSLKPCRVKKAPR